MAVISAAVASVVFGARGGREIEIGQVLKGARTISVPRIRSRIMNDREGPVQSYSLVTSSYVRRILIATRHSYSFHQAYRGQKVRAAKGSAGIRPFIRPACRLPVHNLSSRTPSASLKTDINARSTRLQPFHAHLPSHTYINTQWIIKSASRLVRDIPQLSKGVML